MTFIRQKFSSTVTLVVAKLHSFSKLYFKKNRLRIHHNQTSQGLEEAVHRRLNSVC